MDTVRRQTDPKPSFSLRPGLRPIVILGAPRSGTKLLRDLLGKGENCTTIPYGLNHLWRVGLSYDSGDGRPASDATNVRVRQIRSSLLNLGDVAHTPSSGYLVEKTCANTLRIPFVHRVLPDARYVHIIRDGRDAAVSARNRWQDSPTLRYLLGKLRYVPLRNSTFLLRYLKNLWQGLGTSGSVQYWGPRYDGMMQDVRTHSLLSVCARQWRACVRSSLKDLADLPSDRYISIRYESLVTEQSVLDGVLDFLEIEDATPIRRHYRSVVHDDSVGRWRRDLSSREQETVERLLGSTIDRLDVIPELSDA